MILNILLIGGIVVSLIGMVFNLYRLRYNNDRPNVLVESLIGFGIFSMVFLVSGVLATFYFHFT